MIIIVDTWIKVFFFFKAIQYIYDAGIKLMLMNQ